MPNLKLGKKSEAENASKATNNTYYFARNQMTLTIEREWCLLLVNNGRPIWNTGNPLVARIPVQDRNYIMERASEIGTNLEFGDFNDSCKIEMNQRWVCPKEYFTNYLAWSCIRWNCPHLLISIASVLQANNISGDSLSCLDEDDRSNLSQCLAGKAQSAIIDGYDGSLELRLGLIEWLQQWSGSESDELAELVRETRVMRGVSPYLEEEVDWVKEGF